MGSEQRLGGRVALVTGASRGIGAAVAEAFAEHGAAVAVNHLPTAAMKALAAETVARITAGGGRAVAVAADVGDGHAVHGMVAEVAAALGPIDVLVANAAASFTTPWADISESEWDRVLDTNLKGTWNCARAIYPAMRAAGYGKIVTVSSVMVETGKAGSLHYVASKAGLIGLTRALAREVGSEGIRVNCVMPGAILTEHELEQYPDQDAAARELNGLQCLPGRAVPADLVGAFVYLASHESDFVTGQVLAVDGGWIHH